MGNLDIKRELSVRISQLKAMLDNIPFAAWLKDADGRYVAVNKIREETCGYMEAEMKGKTDHDLFDKSLAGRNSAREGDCMATRRQISYEDNLADGRSEELFISPVIDVSGVVIGTTGLWRDITDKRKRKEEIVYLNHHDLLTGLKNRFYFEGALRRLDTYKALPISIIMVDINGLKLTNDMLGHYEGDRLLKEVAGILSGICREGDVAARIGGDEFGLLLPKTSPVAAKKISDLIAKAWEDLEGESCEESLYPSISTGYATKNERDENLNDVITEAEELMYKRKLLVSKSVHSSIITSIKTTLFEKSHETEEHAGRLIELSKKVGLEMGLNDKNINELSLLASLHDIGKMGVNDYILSKPGKLTDEEWAEIRKHPEVGFRIAQSVPELKAIANYILCHHERWDGKGYPKGLNKRNIPLLSRILAVVDAYDAMTQDRAYRKAAPIALAIQEIIKNSGSQFDPDVAIEFIKTIKGKGKLS